MTKGQVKRPFNLFVEVIRGWASGLIIRRSEVRVLPAPRGKAQVRSYIWPRLGRSARNLPRVCPATVTGKGRGFVSGDSNSGSNPRRIRSKGDGPPQGPSS